ncbi:polysaccharide deacetylase family protein [Haliangium sp.]
MSRERVAELLDRSRAFDVILRGRARVRAPILTVLCYHSVGEPGPDYPFDPEVIDVTPDQFRAQLSYLARHCNVIDIDTLCQGLSGGKLPSNPVLITFDDGYLSCLDTALPILAEFGFPATFFIATHYVSERRLYWWERIHYLIKRSSRVRIELELPRQLTLELGDLGEPGSRDTRGSAARRLLALVKSEKGLDLDAFLDHLAQIAEVAWSDEIEGRITDELIMGWDQVRALHGAGMDIQSHTRSHRVLQTLPPERLAEELAGSRADIEREVGTPARTVAYPVGYSIRDQPILRRAVRDAGYEVGFTNATGVNYLWRDTDPLDVRRIAMGREISMPMFRGQVAMPPLAYVRRT